MPGANFEGLSVDELIAHSLAAPAAIFPSNDSTETLGQARLKSEDWRPIGAPGRVQIEPAAEGVRVRTPNTPGYAVETPLLTAPTDGTYLFRLRFPSGSGATDARRPLYARNSWLAIGYGNEPLGVEAVRTLAVKLHSGQVFSLVASNGAPKTGERSIFVLEELAAHRDESASQAPAPAK